MNRSSAKTSPIVLCSGVPVNAQRRLALSLVTASEFLADGFLEVRPFLIIVRRVGDPGDALAICESTKSWGGNPPDVVCLIQHHPPPPQLQ